MKTLKSTFLIFVILFFISLNRIGAQSYQYEWTNTFDGTGDGDIAYCLGHRFAGTYTYHVVINVDKKTGFIDRVHNNVSHYNLTDLETGEKLILIDVATDRLNHDGNFYFWNWITGANLPIDENLSAEGQLVWATFKFISKGGIKVTMRELHQIHINANGEVVVLNERKYSDCE